MEKNPDPGSGMNILDHFSERLETVFLGLMRIGIRDLFDPGSGIWDGEIRILDPV
jgi:hypothetical protein